MYITTYIYRGFPKLTGNYGGFLEIFKGGSGTSYRQGGGIYRGHQKMLCNQHFANLFEQQKMP